MSPTACGLRAFSAAVLILGFVALCQRVQAQVVIRERVEVTPPVASGSEGGFVEGPAQEGPGRSAPVEGGAARLTTECTGGYQWRLDAAYTFGNPLVHLGGGRGRFEPNCGPITASTPFRITISPAHADYLSLSLDSTDVGGGVDSLDATLGELGDGLYFFANEATPAGVQPVWIMFRPLVDTLGSAILQLNVEPPSFYAHMDYVGLLVQGGSEGEIGFDVSAGVTYYASELYPSTPIEIALSAEGVQFGSLRTSDGTLLTSPVTTTYAELLRDGLKYVADGAKDTTVAAVPELVEVEFAIEGRDTTYTPTAAFGVGGYHYRVTLGDDRIAYGDSVSVVVEPLWADGTVVPLPDDFLLHRLMIRPGIHVSDPDAARSSAFEVLRAQGAATDAEAARRGGPEPSGARLLTDLRDWHTVERDPEEELMPCPGYGPSDPDFRPLRLSVPGAVPLADSTSTTLMRVGCYGEGHHMVTNVPYGLARSGQIYAVADAFNPEPEGGEVLMSGVWAWTIYDASTFPAYPLTVTGFQHYGESGGLLIDPSVRFDVALSRDTLRYAEAAEVTLDAVTGPGVTVPSSYPVTVSVDSLTVDYGGGLVFTYTLGHLVHTGTEERGTTLTGVPYEDLENGLVEFVADGTAAVGGFEPAVVRVEGEQPIDGATPVGARTALVREAWLDVEPSYDSLYYGGSRVLQAVLTDELGAVPYDTTRAFEVWAYQDTEAPGGVLVHDGTAEQDPESVGAVYGDLFAGHVRFLADTTGGPPVARALRRAAAPTLRGSPGVEDGPATRRQAAVERARRARAARQEGHSGGAAPSTHDGAATRSVSAVPVSSVAASLTGERYVGLELVSEDYALYGWIDLLVLPAPMIEFVDFEGDPLAELGVGNWGVIDGTALDPGYEEPTAGGLPVPVNGPSYIPFGNFVDSDVAAFKIRLTNAVGETDPEIVDERIVTLSVQGDGVLDDPTELVLTETGPDTGVFESTLQLLTASDFTLAPTSDPAEAEYHYTDDDFPVNVGSDAFPADDEPGDRTHQVVPGASVNVAYPSGSSDPVQTSAAVCRAGVLPIQAFVLNEPFDDVGYPSGPTGDAGNGRFDWDDANANARHDEGEASEPYSDISNGHYVRIRGDDAVPQDGWGPVVSQAYVEGAVHRTALSWAQACVEVELGGITLVGGYGLDAGLEAELDDIAGDGRIDVTPTAGGYPATSEPTRLFAALETLLDEDAMNAVFVGEMSGADALAQAFPSGASLLEGQGSYELVYIAATRPAPGGAVGLLVPVDSRVLAHEAGHILTALPDPESIAPGIELAEPYMLFPTDVGFYPDGAGPRLDNLVNRIRRITAEAVDLAKASTLLGN